MLKVSPQNRETLTFIENALFAISLDDYSTGMDLDKFIRNMFHGTNAHNRWFDKALSISVESNGRAALNGEVNIKFIFTFQQEFLTKFFIFFVSIHLVMLLYLQLL